MKLRTAFILLVVSVIGAAAYSYYSKRYLETDQVTRARVVDEAMRLRGADVPADAERQIEIQNRMFGFGQASGPAAKTGAQ